MKVNTLNCVNDHVDHVYVVTVKTFEDRIEHIKKEMMKHGISFSFFYEHFTPNLQTDIELKFNTDMKTAYKANVLQHIALWEDAVRKGYKRILVFEDDVILDNNFNYHFNELILEANLLKEDYIVFLGGADSKVPEDFFLSKKPLYPMAIATSEGLIMDLAGIKRRLSWTKNNKIHCPIDHLIAHIDRTEHAQTFWSRKPITSQASISGVLRTKFDKNRLSHSELYNKLRYHWNKFQRRQARAYLVRIKALLINLANKLLHIIQS